MVEQGWQAKGCPGVTVTPLIYEGVQWPPHMYTSHHSGLGKHANLRNLPSGAGYSLCQYFSLHEYKFVDMLR